MNAGKRDTVLIVNDDPDILSVLTRGFKAMFDCEIRLARNGIEALAEIKIEVPDLIILDLMMPGLDGFDTLRIMQNWSDVNDVPIIVVTAMSLDNIQWLEKQLPVYSTQQGFSLAGLVGFVEQHSSLCRTA